MRKEDKKVGGRKLYSKNTNGVVNNGVPTWPVGLVRGIAVRKMKGPCLFLPVKLAVEHN